jgi:hypothetical protein
MRNFNDNFYDNVRSFNVDEEHKVLLVDLVFVVVVVVA